MRYVKANQIGIVLLTILSLLFQQTWILAVLWLIQVAGLLSSGKLNVFVQLAKLILSNKGAETQAAELQRFNNTLAVLFLTFATISFLLNWQVVGYIFSAMLLLAAGAALLGYCIGCTIYFWYKQFRAGRRIGKARTPH